MGREYTLLTIEEHALFLEAVSLYQRFKGLRLSTAHNTLGRRAGEPGCLFVSLFRAFPALFPRHPPLPIGGGYDGDGVPLARAIGMSRGLADYRVLLSQALRTLSSKFLPALAYGLIVITVLLFSPITWYRSFILLAIPVLAAIPIALAVPATRLALALIYMSYL